MTPGAALAIGCAGGLLAWAARALTGSGALAATAIAFAVLSTTGWQGGVVLGSFFLPSTLVSRLGARRGLASDVRGERRDAVQVLANGGAAALGCLAEGLTPGLGFWLLTGSLAAAAADTWATGLGAFSPTEPRLLITGKPVRRGTSGGVSLTGTVGGLVGAAVVAGTGGLLARSASVFGFGVLIGFLGMFLDSWLGASVQGRFQCPACAVPSERRQHRCGSRTGLVGGWRWLDNDGVNALATSTALVFGAIAWGWL